MMFVLTPSQLSYNSPVIKATKEINYVFAKMNFQFLPNMKGDQVLGVWLTTIVNKKKSSKKWERSLKVETTSMPMGPTS